MSKRDKQFEKLTVQMQSGDPAEFRAFWSAVRDSMVFGYLSGIAGPPSDEVMGEIFTHLWQVAPEYNPEKAGLTKWVHMHARNLSIWNQRKSDRFDAVAQLLSSDHTMGETDTSKSWRDPSDESGDEALDIADPSAGPQEMVIGHETLVELVAALQSLAPRRAEAVYRRRVDGDGTAQIAESMGIAQDSARELVGLALAQLRRRMLATHGPMAPSGTLKPVGQVYGGSGGRFHPDHGSVAYERCGPQDTDTVTVRQL